MIETTNPEIDVNELMKRVRLEAAKAGAPPAERGLARAPVVREWLPALRQIPDPPPLALSPPIDWNKQWVDALLRKTRSKIFVSSWIPRIFRRFFQRQGGFNRGVLETINFLAGMFEQMNMRIGQLNAAAEVQNQWLHGLVGQRQVEAAWVKAMQDRIAQLVDLQAQMERHGEHLRSLQVSSDQQGEHLRNLQAESERRSKDSDLAGQHLRDLQSETDRGTQDIRDLREMLVQLGARQASDAVHMKGELSQYGALVQRAFDSAKAGQKKKPGKPPLSATDWEAHRLDSFYVSFEDRFRGSRADIKERVRFYLPILSEADAGRPGRPVTDLGCGRGEWLELLQENGLEAMGLDLNLAMVAQCKERDLPVTQGDAIEYLRSLPDESQGAVTAFHLIEHLPLETLIDLLAEARRVLMPGGLVLFESPNCKNLLVGACYFNVDPTHRNPIFPETIEFMLGSQGFERLKIEYLSPMDTTHIPGIADIPPVLRDLLYGPQDFAAIGRKPISP